VTLLPKVVVGGAIVLFLVALDRELTLQTPLAWIPAVLFGLLIVYAVGVKSGALGVLYPQETWAWDLRGVAIFAMIPLALLGLLLLDAYLACHGGWATGGMYCSDLRF
jgi:hypothetical protein